MECEAHGINIRQTDGTMLIAEVRHVNGHGGGLGVCLMVAMGAVQRAFGGRGFVVCRYFPLPAPLASVFGDEGRRASAATTKLGKVHVVVTDFIRSIGGFPALFTKTKLHFVLLSEMQRTTAAMGLFRRTPREYENKLRHYIKPVSGGTGYHKIFACQGKTCRDIKKNLVAVVNCSPISSA
jgi:hypothetical protein